MSATLETFESPRPEAPSLPPDWARRRRIGAWSLAFGFWTLLALSFAIRMVLSARAENEVLSWQRAFAWNFPNFYLWMLLTPLVGRLGRLTAIRRWPAFFALHVPCSIVIAFAQTTLMLLLDWLLRGPGTHADISFPALFHTEFIYSFHLALLTYWLMLVVLRGMESQRRLKDERLRASRLETQLAQAQLEALRTQLQPHFLFNTLNAISALALADPAQAKLMIARLSDFLRLTLEHHSPQVPLSRELQVLETYLGIQRVRFQDRLTTHLDIAEETSNAAVPNLILQPLVENALRHGLLAKASGGALHISAAREGDVLCLRVEDDGLGLDEDASEGIGLGNTRARLRVRFGDAATLSLTRRPEGGTRAEVRIPFEHHAT